MNILKNHEIQDLVWIEELVPDYPCVVIANAHATAKIALHGAHVIDYTPTDEKPVIFTSKEAIYREGKAIRGGIPVCWPWFSAHPTDTTLPSHGFARNAFWQLFRSSSDKDLTTLIFTYSKNHLHAELTVQVGKELCLTLQTINTGDTPEIVGGALHSYFSISDISEVTISGLEGTAFHDSLTSMEGKENSTITIEREIDRVYQDTVNTVVLKDQQWKREIRVEKSGSHSTVVWNPWVEKSASMRDLDNEDYRKFVCIETANALKDVYSISPGGTHSLGTKISVVSQ